MADNVLTRAMRRLNDLRHARESRRGYEARPRDPDRKWLGIARVSGATIGDTHAERRRKRRRERDERLERRFGA